MKRAESYMLMADESYRYYSPGSPHCAFYGVVATDGLWQLQCQIIVAAGWWQRFQTIGRDAIKRIVRKFYGPIEPRASRG